jgi:hypothetical protein
MSELPPSPIIESQQSRPIPRNRTLRAKHVASILWDRAVIIRGTLTGDEPYPGPEADVAANSVIHRAIEDRSIVPIVNASVESRIVVLARLQTFILEHRKRPEAIVANVSRDSDYGVLLAEALRELQPQSGGGLRMLWRLKR